MEIELNPRWRPNKTKTDIYHHGPRPISYATLATPLLFHYPLPLNQVPNETLKTKLSTHFQSCMSLPPSKPIKVN
jgi:hypothetical protein